jgi:hypothetical protein
VHEKTPGRTRQRVGWPLSPAPCLIPRQTRLLGPRSRIQRAHQAPVHLCRYSCVHVRSRHRFSLSRFHRGNHALAAPCGPEPSYVSCLPAVSVGLRMQNAQSDRKVSPSAASSCLPEPKCSSLGRLTVQVNVGSVARPATRCSTTLDTGATRMSSYPNAGCLARRSSPMVSPCFASS